MERTMQRNDIGSNKFIQSDVFYAFLTREIFIRIRIVSQHFHAQPTQYMYQYPCYFTGFYFATVFRHLEAFQSVQREIAVHGFFTTARCILRLRVSIRARASSATASGIPPVRTTFIPYLAAAFKSTLLKPAQRKGQQFNSVFGHTLLLPLHPPYH